MQHDVVVIGGGAAGLSAATLLARSRRTVTVLDAGEQRNAPAKHVHGFLSRDGTDPADLLTVGRDELMRYGGNLLREAATTIAHTDGGFVVRTATGGLHDARSVVVCTGLRDELPDIAGLPGRWGTDVLHCPYCHGYEVRDLPLAVIGGDNRPFTLHQASLIRQWSSDVIFFPNRITLTEMERTRLTARGVAIADGRVESVVVREDRMYGVELAGGVVVPRSVAFVGPKFVPRDNILVEFGCTTNEDGSVSVDPTGHTSVEGVWAAGNVVDSPAQLVNAAAAGSRAGIAVNHFLLEQDVRAAVAGPPVIAAR